MRTNMLIEVGVEEVPSRYVDEIAERLKVQLVAAFRGERLSVEGARMQFTPRRFIFECTIPTMQEAENEVVRGPQVSVAYREGEPTAALEGFMNRLGIDPTSLQRESVKGKDYVTALVVKPVIPAEEILPKVVQQVLENLKQPRTMRWTDRDYRFVRPVRWLLLLLDNHVIGGEALGALAGAFTYGNRTDCPQSLPVTNIATYWQSLDTGRVMADPEKRRKLIRERGETLAAEAGGRVLWDSELLQEVTNLVEWPTPFLGEFEPEFLELPEPILTTAMRVHQRYFSIVDANGRLLPKFLAVRNGVGDDLDLVRRGNQKVIRARLSDARYFFRLDRERPLAAHEGHLADVTLHAKLGTYADKLERIHTALRDTQGIWDFSPSVTSLVQRAIHLYKCDLLTHVVSEFPELQGEMGGIYARLDGEPHEIAQAISDQYHPGFPGDHVPDNPVGQALGVLDRMDTLMAFYSHGIRARGSEDPFGLRRQALGLGRIVSETPILGKHSLRELMTEVAPLYENGLSVVDEVVALVQSRLTSELEEQWPLSVIQATLAKEFGWQELHARLQFLQARHDDPGYGEILEVVKRITRITSGAVTDVTVPDADDAGIAATLLQYANVALAVPDGNLAGWWEALLVIIPVVHQFFDEVLVMDPDLTVRARRLQLLARVGQAFRRYYAFDVAG